MKRLLIGIFAGAFLCGISLAQDAAGPQGQQSSPTTQSPAASQPASQPASGTLRIAPGSVIPVQLTKSIDAKKAKTGDEIEAKVTQDLKAGNGEVIVPKDTKVMGRVTQAQARTKEQKDSQLGISFDRAVMKNGGDVALPMSIQAIIAPPNLNSDNSNNAGGDQASSGPYGGRTSSGNSGGRSTASGAGTPSQAPSPTTGGEYPSGGQTGTNARQPINGNTQGVVGIADLKLSAAANTAQGSVISSEKNNVKLESGTLMLLRVNQ